MNSDNQERINRFALDLQNASQKASKIITDETANYVKQNHKYNNLVDYAKAHIKSRFEYEAEFLTELGYAKASDVALEVIAEIEKILEVDKNGEAKLNVRELYEIEKKYTEEGK